MCLNQILKDEQVTLMRFAAATDVVEAGVQARKLSFFSHLLEAHPYPHKPYSERNVDELLPALDRPEKSRALSDWKNEGSVR